VYVAELYLLATEQAYIILQEVPGSSLVRVTSVLTELFRDISQSLQANSGTVPRFGQHRFLGNPFQFIIHPAPYHSTPSSIDAYSGVRYTTKKWADIYMQKKYREK
jgi:hypothetical protein